MDTDFKGKGGGPMKAFVDESAKMFNALSAPRFLMPFQYMGEPPTIKIIESEDASSFELDLKDLCVLNSAKTNVRVKIGSGAFFTLKPHQYSLTVSNGQLICTLLTLAD